MLLVTVLATLVVLANAERKKLLIDTDIFSAVDDVGALAIANVFHNSGDVEVVGVMVNTPSKWGPLAVSVCPSPTYSPFSGLISTAGHQHSLWKRPHPCGCDETGYGSHLL